MKHTPGPWKIGALESGQAAVDSVDGTEVTGWVRIPDARLIAAAPKMLAALKAIIDEGTPWAPDTHALMLAREAIQDAGGWK